MLKAWVLVAIIDGTSYNWTYHDTIGQCIDRKIYENNAAADVAEVRPDIKAEFACRQTSK